MNEAMVMTWLNYYECPRCKYIWEDQWDCQVDDDCSECGCRHISPYESKDIEVVNKTNCLQSLSQSNFLDDDEKMADFEILTKEEFLTSYSYLTEQEYDNTKREVNND